MYDARFEERFRSLHNLSKHDEIHAAMRPHGILPKLLLDKSGGNFLTLVENVGFLLQNKMNFENGDVQGKLSKGGENKVKTWEENRQKRIEQMFAGLSDETKNLLGWSGQLGISAIIRVTH